MKKTLSVLAFVALSLVSFAQTENDYLEIVRDVLKTEKKAAIADVMMLTEEESQPFWSLYNQFESALYEVHNKRIAIIKDYAANYESMTDEKADELTNRMFKFEAELMKIEKTYYNKFKKIVPAGKAAKLMQANNKIETMVNYDLALTIPLVETE
jgi:hypothetical protein